METSTQFFDGGFRNFLFVQRIFDALLDAIAYFRGKISIIIFTLI